ncbi:tetratricopeptide repeat protein [Pleurocapsa sp. FMAR1]|uniref:tetratricopeptide repeat protein n=1 Tax=Pleurocapsa sp. FMAR1 TaxID=3040204 RepID=UPI0039AF1F4A
MGDLLKQRNKLDEAIKCYQKTLAIKPDFKSVYRSLGDILMAQGKEIEAKQCYQRA